MIYDVDELEVTAKKIQEKEKQETGFNTVSTLATLELIKIIKLAGKAEN